MPSPRIEPGFHRPQRCVLTTILRWRTYMNYVVLRARVIPECLDNPNLNSLREVTSCQNGLSD